MMRRLARPSQVEVATLARASVMLVLAAAGGVVAANAGGALIVYVPYAMVGAILVIKRPGNRIGWLLTAFAWQFAIGFLPVQAAVEELQSLSAPSIVLAIVWFKVSLGLPLAFALLACLAVVFPTGRLPRGRWRMPTMLLLLAMAAITMLAAIWPVLQVQPEGIDHMIVIPNPLQILPPGRLDEGLGDVPTVAGLVTFALLIASIASLLARYARSDGTERLQLRWLVAGLAAVAIAVPIGFLLFAAFGSVIQGVAWLPAIIAFTLPPIAIGIAVLRYRLYEIDRIISRTIGWAIVSSVLVITFAVAVVALQAMLDRFTQGETLAVAASTLVAFALFQPLRRRVQSAVDRRFDRSRYDAERTVAGFSDRLRGEIDLTELHRDLDTTIRDAISPRSLGIWLRESRR